MGNDVDALDLFYLQSKSKSQRQGIVFPMSQEEEEEEEEEEEQQPPTKNPSISLATKTGRTTTTYVF